MCLIGINSENGRLCPGGGDLVVQGDVPVAKFRVSKSAIYYLIGSKNFQIYYRVWL